MLSEIHLGDCCFKVNEYRSCLIRILSSATVDALQLTKIHTHFLQIRYILHIRERNRILHEIWNDTHARIFAALVSSSLFLIKQHRSVVNRVEAFLIYYFGVSQDISWIFRVIAIYDVQRIMISIMFIPFFVARTFPLAHFYSSTDLFQQNWRRSIKDEIKIYIYIYIFDWNVLYRKFFFS